MASTLLRAARDASFASRAAALASRSARARGAPLASRTAAAAAMASRSAEADASGVIAPRITRTEPRDDRPRISPVEYYSSADYESLPDDVKEPTDKELESDALWAFYERWCKAYNKKHDHAEMARRFKLFRRRARFLHQWNHGLPPDPEEAAIVLQKREEISLLISKGEEISHFDDSLWPMELGPFADEPLSCERLSEKTQEMDGSVQ